jgi:hypothetical protein
MQCLFRFIAESGTGEYGKSCIFTLKNVSNLKPNQKSLQKITVLTANLKAVQHYQKTA